MMVRNKEEEEGVKRERGGEGEKEVCKEIKRLTPLRVPILYSASWVIASSE